MKKMIMSLLILCCIISGCERVQTIDGDNSPESNDNGDIKTRIERSLDKEHWRLAGKLLDRSLGENTESLMKVPEDMISLKHKIPSALKQESVVDQRTTEIFIAKQMKKRHPPLTHEILQQSDQEIMRWFRNMNHWWISEVQLFHNNLVDEIAAKDLNSTFMLITESAIKEMQPFREYVRTWFFVDLSCFSIHRSTDLTIANHEMASVVPYHIEPWETAGYELLNNNTENLLSLSVNDSEISFRIKHPEHTDSFEPGTYTLIYEINEIDKGKYQIKNFNIIDY